MKRMYNIIEQNKQNGACARTIFIIITTVLLNNNTMRMRVFRIFCALRLWRVRMTNCDFWLNGKKK